MTNDLTKIYDGADLSGAAPGIVYLPIVRAGTLTAVKVGSDAAQTGAAVFEVRRNGAVIAGLGALTIADAAKSGTINGLNVALADGDEIVLNLLSGNVSAPVTLNLVTGDGIQLIALDDDSPLPASKVWFGTQAEYDAIVNPNAEILYFIKE
jgi:hypothetical protein